MAPTTDRRAVDFPPIPEEQLDACARILARFAVGEALAELGLDIRSEEGDDAATTK